MVEESDLRWGKHLKYDVVVLCHLKCGECTMRAKIVGKENDLFIMVSFSHNFREFGKTCLKLFFTYVTCFSCAMVNVKYISNNTKPCCPLSG